MNNNCVKVSEGEFVCEITATDVSVNDKDQIVITLPMKIVEGSCSGGFIEKTYHLKKGENDKAKAFLLRELGRMEIHVSNSREFEEHREELIGKRIRIAAVENEEGFMSYYVKGLAKQQEAKASTDTLSW